jgi:hypothetical protein
VQERADGKPIDWSNDVVNVLRADGQWHVARELGIRADSVQRAYASLPVIAVEVEIQGREYRATIVEKRRPALP